MMDDEPNGIPICLANKYSRSGKGSGADFEEELVFETLCVDPDDLANGIIGLGNSTGKSGKGKGSNYLDLEETVGFQCGCCDPLLEGAGLPSYCPGRICEADPTPCSGAKSSSSGKGRMSRELRSIGGSKGSSTGGTGRQGGKGSSFQGVAICVGNVTMCVDDLDPLYVGTNVTCGCCAGDDADYC